MLFIGACTKKEQRGLLAVLFPVRLESLGVRCVRGIQSRGSYLTAWPPKEPSALVSCIEGWLDVPLDVIERSLGNFLPMST